MKRNIRLIIGIVALIAIAIIAVTAWQGRMARESVVARIGYLNITASLPLFIAEENGFFAEEGVQVMASQLETSNQLVDGIAAGNLDAFVEASAVPVLALDLQAPGRLKVFAQSSITKEAPFDALLVKGDSPIKSLRDLAGRRIGVFPGSTASNLLRKFLLDHGVDVTDSTFVPVPPQNHLTALLDGSVDVIHAYEPTTAIALERGGVRKMYGSVYAEMLDRNPQGVAAVASHFIEEHPNEALKMIRALERGMVFMREHEKEARQILEKRMKLQPEVAATSVFLQMIPHGEFDTGVLQRYSDMLTELGELKGKVNVDDLVFRG